MFKLCRYLIVFVVPMCGQQQVSPTINQLPSREFGQPKLLTSLYTISPNLVEGRELWLPYGVAVDTASSPPLLYVADTFNNRVLAWKNPSGLGVCGIGHPTCGFADLVIGQRAGDFTATLAGGAGNPGPNAGFSFPMAVAVDSASNLYVADVANNRILRFPAPLQQSLQNGEVMQPDLVIGQKTTNSGISSNEGNPNPSAKTLNLFAGGSGTVTTLAFDASGGLWVPDPGNNRVLRFPANQLVAGTIEPAADIVMGQSDFQTGTENPTPQGTVGGAPFFKGNLRQPSAVAIAPSGAMYIADGYSRVLYYLPGIASGSTGIQASRILGLGVQINNQPPLTLPNSYQLNSSVFGLFLQGSNLFVADAAENRIVKYDTPDKWPAEGTLQAGQPITTQFSPPMIDVIGQTSLTSSNKINKAQPEPDASTFNTPLGGVFVGNDLWVADRGNNRVVSFVQSAKIATPLVGQLDWPYDTPNLIEGREVNFGTVRATLADVAVDNSSTPPHLYIADANNNRILGFKDVHNLSGTADLVIGQKDFYRSLINGTTNDPQLPN